MTFCIFLPSDVNNLASVNKKDVTKWFKKTPKGWRIKYENPCYGCGSPWCLYHQHCKELNDIVVRMRKNKYLRNNEKRYRCYRDGVAVKWGVMGYANRKRCGWCWENKVRAAFPDGEGLYTDFMALEE